MRSLVLWLLAIYLAGCSTPRPPGKEPSSPPTNERRQVVPKALLISGVAVFAQPEKTHELIKKVQMLETVVDGPTPRSLYSWGQFEAGQKIRWEPITSARPPRHRFVGSWSMNADGTVTVTGRYEPSGDEIHLDPELHGNFIFLISFVTFEEGPDPGAQSLTLLARRQGGAPRE